MIAKCGEIVVHHWAHIAQSNCAYAGETLWHLRWKEWAYEHGCQVEKVVKPGFRADVVTPRGNIIELQSKAPSVATIRAREEAYGRKLHWIFQVSAEQQERIRWTQKRQDGTFGFHYSRGPKTLTYCERPMYLHFVGDERLVGVGFRLLGVDTQWGESERLYGFAWKAVPEVIFDIAAVST